MVSFETSVKSRVQQVTDNELINNTLPLSDNLVLPPKGILSELKQLKEQLKEDVSNKKELQFKINEHMSKLYVEYRISLRSFLHNTFRMDPHTADDVIQNVMKNLYVKADQFNVDRSERPYIFTVTANAALDLLRRSKRHNNLSIDQQYTNNSVMTSNSTSLGDLILDRTENGPDIIAQSIEQGEYINREIREKIEPLVQDKYNHRSYVVLYAEGMAYQEIAAMEKIPVGTVKSRLNKERDFLKKNFAADLAPYLENLDDFLNAA